MRSTSWIDNILLGINALDKKIHDRALAAHLIFGNVLINLPNAARI
uniref:Uncharacterized protein n=1 Tax=Anguilla anguilla TaxID=7936 RepID=A0A0E9VX13_ANGAN